MPENTAKLAAIDEMMANSMKKIVDLREQLGAESDFHARLSREHDRLASRDKPAALSGHHRNGRARSVREHVTEVLKEHGKPMRASKIVEELEKRGVTTTSERGLLPSVLSVVTKRTDEFTRVDRGTYALIEETGE